MTIKTLFLSSAAALCAFSGAHAADAIVAAEPEPMEYVRVCDAFGTGYFYIPGTETCLKVGGQVRFEVGAGDAYTPNSDDGITSLSRAEITLDTASDTEYGALKSSILTRWDWTDEAGTNMRLMQATISLGGFTVGLADSQFQQYVGYLGDVANDDVINDGPDEQNQISYSYDAGNGFTGVVAVEDGDSGNYRPDVVAGLGYSTGILGFKVIGGYDAEVEEGAIKARLDANVGSIKAWVMGGWNTDGDKLNKYAGSSFGGDAADIGWGDWAVWGGFGVNMTDTTAANLQLGYTDSKVFAATANVQWHVVPNLLIQPEVSYTNWDSIDEDQWAGLVRFQRTF